MFRASIFGLLLATGAVYADSFADAPKMGRRVGPTSSGWIDFKPYKASGIFFPARVNSRDAIMFLYGGPTMVDKFFAGSVGLEKPGSRSDERSVTGVTVEIGGFTLSDIQAVATINPPRAN